MIEMKSKTGAKILADERSVATLEAGGAVRVGAEVDVLAKARKDLRTVKRDELVVLCMERGIDPPDAGNKKDLLKLLDAHDGA